MEVVYLILLLATATVAQQNKSIGKKKTCPEETCEFIFCWSVIFFQDGGIAFVAQWMGKWSMTWTQHLWTAMKNAKRTKMKGSSLMKCSSVMSRIRTIQICANWVPVTLMVTVSKVCTEKVPKSSRFLDVFQWKYWHHETILYYAKCPSPTGISIPSNAAINLTGAMRS